MMKKYISILAIFFMIFSVYNSIILHIDKKILLGANVVLGLASIYYTRKDNTWLIRLIAIAISGGLFLLSKNGMFLYGILGACAVSVDNKISFTTILKRILTIEIFFFILIVLLDLIGVLHDKIYHTSSGAIRYTLGFGNPNITAMRMFIIAVSAIYLYKKEKYNKYLFILVTIVFPATILYLTHTRTALLTYVLSYIAFFAYDKNFVKPLGKFKKLILLIPTLLFGISILIATCFGRNSFLNKVLSTRPLLWNDYIYYFHCTPTLFGRNDQIVTVMRKQFYPLDGSYIYLLIIDGILITAITIIGITLCMHLMLKKNLLADIIFITSFLIYGFTETMLINPRRNISFILVFSYLMFYYSKKFEINKKFHFKRTDN